MTKKIEILKQIKELIISNPEYFAIVNKDKSYDNIRYEVNELLYQLKYEATIRANNELTILEKAIRSASEFLNNAKMVSSNGVDKLTTLYEKAEHELKISKEKLASENYIAILEAIKIASSSLDTANSVISESKSIIRNANIEEERNREIRNRRVKDDLAGFLYIAIVLGIIFAIFILPFLPEKTITFCGDKWKKDINILSVNSWNIKEDMDGNCMLGGSGKISIPTLIFSRIKIIPAEKSPTDFEFKVGEYYTAGSGTTGTPCRQIGMFSYDKLYYQPYFAYNNNMKDKTDNKCVEYYPNLQDITLSRSVTGWERNLQLSIADNPLAEMMLGSGNHQPTTGGVTFYSSQIDIAEIKIYCDMRCIIERISNL